MGRRGRTDKQPERESRFNQRTLDLWQSRSHRELNGEDVRQITENMVGFFRILIEWETKERLFQDEILKKNFLTSEYIYDTLISIIVEAVNG